MNANDIMVCKGFHDTNLHRSFEKKFNTILSKFDSLSKHTHYKKIQKVSFIENNDTEDNILVMLNKLTPLNFKTISEKLIMQVTSSNISSFVRQILSYSSRQEVNCEFLWILIVNLCSITNLLSIDIETDINNQINTYINDFIKTFNINKQTDLSSEEYSDFVNRLSENKAVINTLKLVIHILESQKLTFLNRQIDINILHTILIDRLMQIINNDFNDNLCFVLLESIMVLTPHEILAKNPFAYRKFKNTFGCNAIITKLSNKNRFKLMDIIDHIDKHLNTTSGKR